MHKLVELYKENSEEWSGKARELEGVIKALEVGFQFIWLSTVLDCAEISLPF